MYTYQDLRKLAIAKGIKDNPVSIGFWIKYQGYKKIKKQIQYRRKIFYLKPDEE